MALRAGTRRWLMRLAFGVLLVASSLLLGLRLGRPLYYSDGAQQYDGAELAHAGMLQWRAPQPVGELPGPVAGRVARLADGRFLYGRLQQDGTADLVLFDARHPAVPPEPLFAANSAANDLAPCVLADGRVLFASDRDGGHGGYDLYELPALGALAASVRPWTICNTALDETDPAVAGDGTVVFVRSDRRIDGGNDGALFRWREGDATEPGRLFDDPGRAARSVDRDPAFAADGASLWFVRKVPGEPLCVVRASRLGAAFAPPLPVLTTSTDVRSPLPGDDGRVLGLLQARPGDAAAALWYEARAQELVPWWPGQHWIEWLLLGAIASSLLLLVLLHYGRRWSTLDLLAQCLLLSLLLHVLLFFWLMGVEILGAPLPGDDEGGSVEVALVATSSSDAANGDLAQAIAAEVRMRVSERALQAELPGTAAAKASVGNSLAAAAAARDEALPAAATMTTTAPALADGAAAQPLREASDAPAAAAAAAALPAVAAQAAEAPAAQLAASTAAASQVVVVAVPAAGSLARSGLANVAAPAAAPPAASAMVPVAHAAPTAPALQDAATPAMATAGEALRAAADAPRAARQAAAIAVEGAATADVAVARSSSPSSAAESASSPASVAPRPASALAKPGDAALAAPSAALAAAAPANTAARRPLPDVALRDAANAGASPAVARGERAEDARAPKPTALPTAPAAPVASAGAAAQRQAETGERAAPIAAVPAPAPGGALVRGGGARPATAAAGAPPVAAAAPRAAASPPPLALRDPASSAATGQPAATPSSNANATAAARTTPAAALPPLAGATAAEVAAARQRETGSLPQPATSLPRPAGALVRAGSPVPVPAGAPSPANAADAARAQPTPAAVALRDRGATPAPAAAPVAAAAQGVRQARTAGVLPALAAGASSVVAERAPWRGERTLPPEPPPAPPASRLARAPAAPLAADDAELRVAGTAYSNRFGPAKAQAIERFGGNDATERAVQNGLRYLARIQNRDGSWGDRSDYDGKYGFVYVGKTALCVLAFLGAGHTQQSRSEHSAVVAKALDHLLAQQEEDTGAFGRSSCYGHGIATYALAECYGLTKDEALLRPLERALQWILDHQGPRRDRRNRGGWGYFSPGLRAEDDYARVSVSSWMIMALESARLSGIELPADVLPAAREYLELSYDQPNGWFRYNHKPSRVNSGWPTLPASTPAAAFCLQLLGRRGDDPMVQSAVDYTVERRPLRYRRYSDDDFVLRGQGNVYFWYYGTLCCFLRGGDAWTQWNERLRTVLPKAQGDDGSFAPIDVYADEAGDTQNDKSYTTAMCVLCLEVYYRYFTPLLLGR
jgi:hypothetical protein